ncbi:MAG: hypothetical protein E7641_00445 [Ruminococcaceae bacterium]|nr:hypothetical protein [Oscillospiraceae bacterium]
MRWEDLREEEFDDAIERSGGVCVLPVGCLEMHGQHLPVGTDTKTCTYIALEAARLEEVVVFSGLYFGSVPGLHMWKGSIDLSLELRLELLRELCSEIGRNGFDTVMLLNGHGGNRAVLDEFVRSVGGKINNVKVVTRNEFQYGIQRLARDLRGGQKFPELTEEDKEKVLTFAENRYLTGHASVNETSIMLAIDGENVDLSRAEAVSGLNLHITDGYRRRPHSINGELGFWLTDHPNSFEGEHIELSSANIGRAILRRRIELQAKACGDLKKRYVKKK